ncbi:universal stress protein [Trichloromonas sp.]|uniref:universal stress protein n=1 Tax=Trichloromonas sp. TaxID=3069249 RepID=UPI003D8138F9
MPETTKKILVAFDDSPSSHKAFDFALGLVKNCLGEHYLVTVLSVVQSPDLIDVPMDIEPMIDSARTRLETAQQALQEKARSAKQAIATECIVGHPAEAIVDYATQNRYDMVILGNRGRSRVAEWLLGSVSHQVATHARCTVTIVK